METTPNEQFLVQLMELYQTAALPCAVTDADFYIVWCTDAARAALPLFALRDGVRAFFVGSDPADLRAEIAAHGSCTVNGAGLFPVPRLTICALPESDGDARYLVQPAALPDIGTGMAPAGPALAISAFGAQYRTPLTTLFSALALLGQQNDQRVDPDDHDRTQEYLQEVSDSAYRLLRACDWMCVYTKLSQGLWLSLDQRLDVFAWLGAQCAAAAAFAQGLGIPLTYDAPDDPLWLTCDPGKLSAILHNLLSNALRYTRPGNAVAVHARRLQGNVCISVADSGVGIPAWVQPQVFQPFFSFEGSGRPFAGTGLGLAIAKESAAALGGTITLVSEEGHGTTVTFTLPVADDPAAPALLEAFDAAYLSDRFSPLRIALADARPCR